MVKICGLRTEEDGVACREAGATLAGLLFVAGRRRAIRAPEARRIRRVLGACRPVLVYLDETFDTIAIETEALGIDRVQLHGSESPEACARLREVGLWVMKALRFEGRRGALEREARRYAGAVDALLIDAPRPGAGEAVDWRRLEDLWLQRPFLLAGGLTPENVAEAVARVRPDGVDVASGIEREGRPCPERVARFVQEARRALSSLPSGGVS
jgi:phosphoribosylanthranilate isomerase